MQLRRAQLVLALVVLVPTVLMIAVVYLLPEGIVPAVTRWWRGLGSNGAKT